MEDKVTTEDRFIVPGWLRSASNGRLVLIGRRCLDCGVSFFPPAARCKSCGSSRGEESEFGPEAALHSFTVDRTGTFLGRPHLVGQAVFSNGAFVQGFVDAPIDAPPALDSPVALVPLEVPVPRTEEKLVTYAFRPLEVQHA
jgi:uncharacterized OB-fold protein